MRTDLTPNPESLQRRRLLRAAVRGGIYGMLILGSPLLFVASEPVRYAGQLRDRHTREPIADGVVTLGETVARTDATGAFEIIGTALRIGFRAAGFGRTELDVMQIQRTGMLVELEPVRPKALYLSPFGAASRALREAALEVLAEAALNALVIDVKSDYGMLSWTSAAAAAAGITLPQKSAIAELPGLLARLREAGIYTIARIVVFKDHPFASARPELAVRTRDGGVFRDREGFAWADPSRRETWEYNLAVAVEAAQRGFDEIQFDYVRFPDQSGLVFAQPNTERARVEAITGFLAEARRRLAPYNVFVAADIFGYVLWNPDDTGVGQQLERLPAVVDYLSPMLYPSSFHLGIPGYPNPVAHPYEIVYRSLERARARTAISPLRLRPWLQAFRDYAFDRRAFDTEEIGAQIRAADTFGSDGWMLWNPRNVYSAAGLGGPRNP